MSKAARAANGPPRVATARAPRVAVWAVTGKPWPDVVALFRKNAEA